MSQPYDDQNVFAKILRGEIPSFKVYEDDVALAFMDVMPQGDGHTLVVPKVRAANLLDIEPEALAAFATRVHTVARAVKTAFEADGLSVLQFNGPAAGQTVFHLHVHLIPRFDGTPLRPHSDTMADKTVLQANAEKVIAALAG